MEKDRMTLPQFLLKTVADLYVDDSPSRATPANSIMAQVKADLMKHFGDPDIKVGFSSEYPIVTIGEVAKNSVKNKIKIETGAKTYIITIERY